MKPPIRPDKKISDGQREREFWRAADNASKEVASWPKWKKKAVAQATLPRLDYEP